MFGKLFKTDPFLSLFPPTHPHPSGKLKTVMPAAASPHHMLEGCASSCVCFLHFPSTCQFLNYPTRSRVDVNPCSTFPFSGVSVDSGALEALEVVNSKPCWAHVSQDGCKSLRMSLYLVLPALCLRAPSPVTVKVWNMRRGCSQAFSLPLHVRNLWDRYHCALGNLALEAGSAT